MLLVNTVLTLPHVRYAVARAYVDYIFVIVFSAKIYESYILSISLTYNLHVRTCAERSARDSWKSRLLILLPFVHHLPALPTRLLRSVSPSDEFPSAKLLLFSSRFPIFPIIETPIPYNSAYSIFYLLEKG